MGWSYRRREGEGMGWDGAIGEGKGKRWGGMRREKAIPNPDDWKSCISLCMICLRVSSLLACCSR